MDVLLGTAVMALELVPASKMLLGNDIPQGNTGKPIPYIFKQSHSQSS